MLKGLAPVVDAEPKAPLREELPPSYDLRVTQLLREIKWHVDPELDELCSPPGDEVVRNFPRAVGNYLLLRRVGGGGMGVVFEATNRRSGQGVALKFLRSGEGGNQVAADSFLQFRREYEILQTLQHTCFVSAHEFGLQEGYCFFAMDYAEGVNTENWLTGFRSAQEKYEAIKSLLLQVVDGLEALHQKGWTHGDIKGENILVQSSGGIKILDLGLATKMGSSCYLQNEGVCGTPAYMSPEQVEGRRLFAESDFYSLGCVLYEWLTGKLPFAGPLSSSLFRRTEQNGPNPYELAPEAPKELLQVCRNLTRRFPEERWTGDEVRKCLSRSSSPKNFEQLFTLKRQRGEGLGIFPAGR